jgi:hypothetical protein
MTDNAILEIAVRISKGLLWLFTTQRGLLCIGIGFFIVFLVRFINALKQRSLLLAALGKKPGLSHTFAVIAQEIITILTWAAANIPMLVAVVAILSVVVALSGAMSKFDEFLNLQQKIREYTLVVKNLERRYKVARVECLAQEDGNTKLSMVYYDQDGNPVEGGKELLEIEGSDIYIDALVINFAYFGVESGENRNLAVPYRVFSEKVAQKNGLPLNLVTSKGIPYFFERDAYQVMGLDKRVFDSRLRELMKLAEDAERARKAGLVRTLYGNAVHRVMNTGDAFFVWIEQTGGLTIKEERAF